MGVDPYTHSILWSRRFIGLKLFLTLAVLGWEGYRMHVERSLDMADRLRDLLHANGWQVVNESPLAVLCFVDAETTADPAAIAAHVVADGRAWISAAKFEGRPVLRACITSQLCAVGEIQSVDENGRGFPLAIDLHTVLVGNERDGMLTAVATPVRRDSDGRANKSHRSV